MESYEIDRLIRDYVVWAAGEEPPLRAEGIPPSVQFSLAERDDGALLVTITNHTHSPVRTPMSGPVSSSDNLTHRPIVAGSIRWVASLNQISFEVCADGDRRIDSATGTAQLSGQGDGWATVELPRLRAGECVVLNRASED